MSRRSRKRGARGVKLSWGKAVLGSLVLLGVCVFAGYAALRSYLHGDGFRKFLSAKVSQAAGVQGEFTPFQWQGLSVGTDAFTAQGEERVKVLRAEGLHTEIGLGGVKRGVWEVKNTVLNRLELSLDTRIPQKTQEKKADPPEVKRAKRSPLLPNEIELSEADLRQVNLRVLSSSGLAVASGMRVNAQQTRGNRSYRADVTGGEIRLPWKHVPQLSLDHARLRYQQGMIFLSDGRLTAEGGGSVHADGEWHREDRSLSLDGRMEGLPCEKVLTGDWAKRLSGSVSSSFSVQGKKGALSSSGKMELTKGVLTALPVLDALAAYADTRRFRVLNLSEAHTDWHWEKGMIQLTNFVLASEGLVRLEGSLTIREGKLDGNFMLGIAPGTLSSIPGAEEDVFLPGDRSLLWTPLRVTGTVDDPEEDLTGRLVAAAGVRMFEILPASGAKALKFSHTVLGDSADKTIERGEKILKEGEKTIREVSDVLEGILGK